MNTYLKIIGVSVAIMACTDKRNTVPPTIAAPTISTTNSTGNRIALAWTPTTTDM